MSRLESQVAQNSHSLELRQDLALEFDARGNPQGQLIRTQMEIAHAFRQGIEPALVLVDTEQELLKKIVPIETERLAAWSARDIVFRRGCVERLSLSARCFLEHGEALFQTIPLRGVRFVSTQGLLDDLIHHELFQRLEHVDLSGCQLSPEFVHRLARVHLPNLQSLNLSKNPLGQAGLQALCTPRWRWQLRRLTLDDIQIHNLALLMQDGAFVELQSLSLAGNPLGDDSQSVMAFPQLRYLNLSQTDLVNVPKRLPPGLSCLDLSFNSIDQIPDWGMHKLQRLSLRGCRLTCEKLQHANFDGVKRVDLTANFLGDGIANILSERCRDFMSLNLSNTLLTDRAIETMIELGVAPHLDELDLSWNAITDVSIQTLAKSNSWRDLKTVNIDGTRVSRKAATSLLFFKNQGTEVRCF